MKSDWKEIGEKAGDWYEIRAEFSAVLTEQEVFMAAGSIGYALREVIRGEELSEPLKVKRKGEKTIVRFGYDSTKTRSDAPDEAAAFALAARYVAEGSPVSKTDRAGAGTKGTRLCAGIGPVNVKFWVR